MPPPKAMAPPRVLATLVKNGDGTYTFTRNADLIHLTFSSGGQLLREVDRNGYTTTLSVGWGGTGYTPVRGDFDGDGKTDLAVYQRSTGKWYVLLSASGYKTSFSASWGGSAYSPVPVYP